LGGLSDREAGIATRPANASLACDFSFASLWVRDVFPGYDRVGYRRLAEPFALRRNAFGVREGMAMGGATTTTFPLYDGHGNMAATLARNLGLIVK